MNQQIFTISDSDSDSALLMKITQAIGLSQKPNIPDLKFDYGNGAWMEDIEVERIKDRIIYQPVFESIDIQTVKGRFVIVQTI